MQSKIRYFEATNITKETLLKHVFERDKSGKILFTCTVMDCVGNTVIS